MNTTQTTAPPVIGTCRKGHVVTAARDDVRMGWITCPCGSFAIAKSMTITYREIPCSAKCTSAAGPSCSCSCRGKNHGLDRRFA